MITKINKVGGTFLLVSDECDFVSLISDDDLDYEYNYDIAISKMFNKTIDFYISSIDWNDFVKFVNEVNEVVQLGFSEVNDNV
jgi:hypothetical protein